MEKKLVFENGAEFYGRGFGADAERVCEVVFNTSMAGYQEVLSDPSYHGQMVCMCYPLVGNTGLCDDDYESRGLMAGGVIAREYSDTAANFRAVKTLAEGMEECGMPGIAGVDTRRITRMLRDEGSMRAVLCAAATPAAEALAKIKGTAVPHGQVGEVSCKKKWYLRAPGVRYNVAVVDCGVKLSMVRELAKLGCTCTVLPYSTPAEDILALAPDGVLISNGPGNPEDVGCAVETVRGLQGRLPMFGICLGHQLIALANGCKTYKLKFGHRGGNHPVQELATGKIEITSQNHSYAVDADSVGNTKLSVSHLNLLDGTVEGLAGEKQRLFTVQYHPESRPGPEDARHLFGRFLGLMEDFRSKGGARHA